MSDRVRSRGLIEQLLKLTLGTVTLDRLDTRAFDDLHRTLGAEIGAATILKVHLVARGALDRAIRWGWIERNPAAAAEPPPVHPPVIRPPMPEELARLLDTAEREDPVFALWLRVAATTGARRGELCALRWNDLDFEAHTVTIERGVVVVAGGVLERPTKTHNRRTLALDGTTLELLAGHRRIRAHELQLHGLPPPGGKALFRNPASLTVVVMGAETVPAIMTGWMKYH